MKQTITPEQLDLRQIPYDQIKFGWLSRIVEQIKPSQLVVTKEQSEGIFGIGNQTWAFYRGIKIKVK